MKRIRTLRISAFFGLTHFFIGFAGVGILTLFSLVFLYQAGLQDCQRSVDDAAALVAVEIAPVLRPPALNPDGLNDLIVARLERYEGAEYALYGESGSLVIASQPLSMIDQGAPAPQENDPAVRAGAGGQMWIYSTAPVQAGGDGAGGLLVLGVPLTAAMAPTYQSMTTLGSIALLLMGLIVVAGWLSSAYLSKPVVALSRAARQMSGGDFSARTNVEGPREVMDLAQTLNEMAARLEHSIHSIHAFVANASHELRTPLTGIRLQIEALRGGAMDEPEVADRFFNQIESEIERMTRLVNDLLDLSNIEGVGVIRSQPVDLYDLACEVHSFWEARAQASGIELLLQVTTSLPPVPGDPYQLRRLFDNLLDNAIKNTPGRGQVTIAIKPGTAPRRVRIEVTDTGSGIPPEHLGHIFERFYRVEPRQSQPGSGLGLAIASSIVDAHKGAIGVQSDVGRGSTFWVELPG